MITTGSYKLGDLVKAVAVILTGETLAGDDAAQLSHNEQFIHLLGKRGWTIEIVQGDSGIRLLNEKKTDREIATVEAACAVILNAKITGAVHLDERPLDRKAEARRDIQALENAITLIKHESGLVEE